MIDHDSKEHLLESEDGDVHIVSRPNSFTLSRGAISAGLFCFLVSLGLNVALYVGRSKNIGSGIEDVSAYTGLRAEVPTVYRFFTDYWTGEEDNRTQSDKFWETIDIDHAAVALSKEYIKEHQLEESNTFPWDTDKQVYFIKVYHHLHCLKVMRRSFDEYVMHGKSSIADHHIYHCLDAIRQDVMCRLDDTPMPIPPGRGNVVGEGQHLMCRDINKLNKWIKAPEQDACYGEINNFIPIAHTLEHFTNCPKDSKYYPVMTGYFDIHGHKNPFGFGESDGE